MSVQALAFEQAKGWANLLGFSMFAYYESLCADAKYEREDSTFGPLL